MKLEEVQEDTQELSHLELERRIAALKGWQNIVMDLRCGKDDRLLGDKKIVSSDHASTSLGIRTIPRWTRDRGAAVELLEEKHLSIVRTKANWICGHMRVDLHGDYYWGRLYAMGRYLPRVIAEAYLIAHYLEEE